MLISEAPRTTPKAPERLPSIIQEPVLPDNPTPLNVLDGMFVTANDTVLNGGSDNLLADFALNIGKVRQNIAAHNVFSQQSNTIGRNDLLAVQDALGDGSLPPQEAEAIANYIETESKTPRLAVDSAISTLGTTPDGQKSVENSYRIAQTIEEQVKATEGFGNTVYNTMVSLIPFRNNMLSNELIGKMGMGSWEKFVNYYRSQNPETQSQITDQLLSKLDRIEGYDWEKESFLSDLISNSSDQSLGMKKVFQWLDVGGSVVTGGEVAAARLAMKSRLAATHAAKINPAKVLEDSGNTTLAGQVNGAAISSPDLASKFNVERSSAMFDSIFKTNRTENLLSTPQVSSEATLSALNGGRHYDPTKVNEFARKAEDEIKSLDYLNPQLFTSEEKVAAIDKAAREHVNKVASQNQYTSTTVPVINIIDDLKDPTKVSMELSYQAEKELSIPHALQSKVIEAKKELESSPKMNTKRLASKLGITEQDAALIRNEVKQTKKDPNYKSDINTPKIEVQKLDLTERIDVDLTKDAWGKMEEMWNTDHVFSGMGTSPKMQFRSKADNSTTVNRIVEDSGLIISAREQFGNVVGGLYNESIKSIGFGGKKRLNKALADADATNTIHTPTDLATKFGMKTKEIDSYYKINKLLDIAKDVEDFKAYRTAKLNNTKEAAAGNTILRGRVFDDVGGGFTETLRGMGHRTPETVLDVASNKVIKYGDLAAHMKATGGKLMVSDTIHPTPHGNFSAVLLPETSIQDVTFDSFRSVGRNGYVPIIRPSAKYFVDEEIETIVNGNKLIHTRTVGAGTTKAEQRAIIKERQDAIAAGKVEGITDPSKVSGRYDREGVAPSSDVSNNTNRTFTGFRSSRDLVWKGVADRRLPPLQAIAKNMEYLGNSYPINEWKMAMLERWKNSVRASRTPQANDNELSLHTPIDQGTAQGRVLEAQRKYLASTLGIPSEGQLHWEGLTVRLSEFIEGGKLRDALARSLREASTKDVIASIKYHTFHSLLGWFNPAQLIVQASNIANVASINPWLTTTHFHKMMALRAMVHIKNDKAIKFIGNKSGFGEELVDIVKQFRRVGGDQLELNADFNAALQGMGVARAAFHKAAVTGLLPYYHGELSARTVAYVTARAKVMRDNNILDWKKLTDNHHRLINDRFKNLSLNLGRENQASFQRGIAGAATQFMHVQTKYLETFFGKKFTVAEKIRMVVGNIALFGAAGIPFGTYLAEKYAGMNRNEDGGYNGDVPEEVIRQGLLGFIAGDTDLAGRLAIPNGLSDQIMKVLDDTGDPLWSTLMGASGTLLQRGSYAANMTAAFMFAPDAVTEKSFWDVMRAWGGIASSYNNAEQAYFMYQTDRFIAKNSGKILFNSPTNQEIISKALGFASVREKESYEMALDIKNRENYIKKSVDRFFKQIINNGDNPYSLEFSDKFRDSLQVWANVAGGGDEFDVTAIQRGVWERLANPQSKEEKALADVIRNSASKEIDARSVKKAIEDRYGE